MLYFDTPISYGRARSVRQTRSPWLWLEGFGRATGSLFLQNVPQFLIAIMATWKPGGIVVSVNPMLKDRELSRAQDSGAGGLICSRCGMRWRATSCQRPTRSRSRPPSLTSSTRSRRCSGRGAAPRPGHVDFVELIERHRDGRPSRPQRLRFPRHRVAHLHLGHHRAPEGRDEHPRKRRVQRPRYRDWIGLADADVAFGVAPLFHITGWSATSPWRFSPDAAGARLPVRRGPDDGAYRASRRDLHGHGDHRILRHHERSGRGQRSVRAGQGLQLRRADRPAIVKRFSRKSAPTSTISTASPRRPRRRTRCRSAGEPPSIRLGRTVGRRSHLQHVARVIDEDGNDVPVGPPAKSSPGPGVVPRLLEQAGRDRGGHARRGDAHGRRRADGRGRLVLPRRPQEGQINASGYKVWPREVEDALYGHDAVREVASSVCRTSTAARRSRHLSASGPANQ